MVALRREPIQIILRHRIVEYKAALCVDQSPDTAQMRSNGLILPIAEPLRFAGHDVLKTLQNVPMSLSCKELAETLNISKSTVRNKTKPLMDRGLVQRTSQLVNGRMTYFYTLARPPETFRFTACYVQKQCSCGKWRRLVHLPTGEWYMWCSCGENRRFTKGQVGR
jgi:predicted transcriptional regulator